VTPACARLWTPILPSSSSTAADIRVGQYPHHRARVPGGGLGRLLPYQRGSGVRLQAPLAWGHAEGILPRVRRRRLSPDSAWHGLHRPRGVFRRVCDRRCPPQEEPCTRRGTPGNDILRGTARDDVICGGGGNDIVYGLSGNDELRAGDVNDILRGGEGNDRPRGRERERPAGRRTRK
jgi:RTX calcium-binding nonapeptide repeat (4 copies)